MSTYYFDFSQVLGYYPALLYGFLKTLQISGLASVLCFVMVGIIYLVRFGISDSTRWAIDIAVKVYIDIVQALPVLVVLVWVYFGLPILGMRIGPDTASIVVLGVSFSAFALDLFMGAERAVSREQIHAATVHGVSRFTVTARILTPFILRTTADPLVGQIITVIKLSTFAMIVGSQEVLSVSNGIITTTYRPLEIYTLVALIFIVTIVPVNLIRRAIIHQAALRGEIS